MCSSITQLSYFDITMRNKKEIFKYENTDWDGNVDFTDHDHDDGGGHNVNDEGKDDDENDKADDGGGGESHDDDVDEDDGGQECQEHIRADGCTFSAPLFRYF